MDDILELRWTTSRGRETYGYNICSLYFNGKKAASCSGGGYDMAGTSLGIWAAQRFQDRLKPLADRARYNYLRTGKDLAQIAKGNGDSFYSMTAYWLDEDKTQLEKVSLDGGCGFEEVIRVLEKIGVVMQRRVEIGSNRIYVVRGA